MNNKKAKQLRKLARAKTVGRPAVAYNEREQKLILGKHVWMPITLSTRCTRYIYKQLKKLAA